MKRILLTALLLAGCERSTTVTVSSGPAPAAPPARPAPATGAAPTAPDAQVLPPPLPPLPPSTSLPKSAIGYVGRWAATEALCARGAWEFTPVKLSTAGEVSCVFREIKYSQSTLGRHVYRLRARCTAEGAETEETFTLTPGRAPPFNAMTVRGGPWQGPIALKRCPEPRP